MNYTNTKDAFKSPHAYVEITGQDGFKYSLLCDFSTLDQQESSVNQIAYLAQFLAATHVAGLYVPCEKAGSRSAQEVLLFDYPRNGPVVTDLCELKRSRQGRVKRIRRPTGDQLHDFLFEGIYQRSVLDSESLQRALMPIVSKCRQVTRQAVH